MRAICCGVAEAVFVFESDLSLAEYVVVVGSGCLEPVVAVLSRYEDNVRWLSRNYEGLKTKFKDEWVAVLSGSVINHDRDLAILVERLRKKHPEAFSEIATDYVTAREIELIL